MVYTNNQRGRGMPPPDHISGGGQFTGSSTDFQTGIDQLGTATRSLSILGGLNPQPAAQPNYNFGSGPNVGQGGISPQQYQNMLALNGQHIDAVISQMQAASEAQAQATLAGLGGVNAQRQAALYGQTAGLRDIGQQTDAAVEGATGNALQRGIYDSGIRQENQATALREGAEAETDLRAQTQFQLQALAAQAAQIRASASAIRAGSTVAQTQTRFGMQQGFQQEMLGFLQNIGLSPQHMNQIMGWVQNASAGSTPAGVRAN